MPNETEIPAWALQVADDFHGAQEVDLELAALIAARLSPGVARLTRSERAGMIEAMIAKEVAS